MMNFNNRCRIRFSKVEKHKNKPKKGLDVTYVTPFVTIVLKR